MAFHQAQDAGMGPLCAVRFGHRRTIGQILCASTRSSFILPAPQLYQYLRLCTTPNET